ncbi:hypothetical protein AC1031_009514 [Aphanomyces cochlioides]|nr:hypothetical protein AC1031_009514 [Aphanomyces cochlioides]
MESNPAMNTILEFIGDKQDDVNLSPEETRKVFSLLGLDLTDAQIKLLEDIPLDEFLQSIETQFHPSRPSSSADDDEEKLPAATMPTSLLRDDHTISYNQLHEFLKNCHLDIPHEAIVEFLSGCTSTTDLGSELYVDKEGLHSFLEKHAAIKQAQTKANKNKNKKRKAKAKKRASADAAAAATCAP